MMNFKSILLAATLLCPATRAHAFCMIVDHTYPKAGWISGDSRQMTVADEYRASKYVFLGKVISQRQIELHDGGFDATLYRVAVTQSFQGAPTTPLTIYNSNTTARFDMDVGKSYLLFVLASGKYFVVDNCGWSDEVSEAKPALKELEHRADFSTRPFHCWKNKKMRGCVPDLRTYPGGKKPEGTL
jgi:hypothetical protein